MSQKPLTYQIQMSPKVRTSHFINLSGLNIVMTIVSNHSISLSKNEKKSHFIYSVLDQNCPLISMFLQFWSKICVFSMTLAPVHVHDGFLNSSSTTLVYINNIMSLSITINSNPLFSCLKM